MNGQDFAITDATKGVRATFALMDVLNLKGGADMTTSDSRVWMPRSDICNRSPFQTGVDRALANAFPPVTGAELPGRIEAALLRLERALQAHEAQGHDPTARPTIA